MTTPYLAHLLRGGAPQPIAAIDRALLAAAQLVDDRDRLLALLLAVEHFAEPLDDTAAALLRCAVERLEKVGVIDELRLALGELGEARP